MFGSKAPQPGLAGQSRNWMRAQFQILVKQYWFYQFNKWLDILKGGIFTSVPIGLKNWVNTPIFLPVLMIQVTVKELS